ncbi:heat-inducible transcriptional repressor HrcA [Rubellimicrobium sp. CFH 75288]|uniref:heat-inducible transcriptional repressor HrcA n=1 Tax=Rubellimicrobium sp. CFH 75288 TaxID=2697034 RepID=UPI00144CA604|nr:heat-inducible transcriptional repressor HrcA [Rubellimicrobium sp. CFH 75288]NAZ37761.1 heat-inducible transcriptional repressor HrcA [Rubellimicrobium sp. CFH 75288]
MPTRPGLIEEMNERSREVFRRVVEAYLETGQPVGSRTLTRSMSEPVSAATIRNVMQDLEEMGLLGHPHVSAGRMPTQAGLRLFVDGLLEVGPLEGEDRARIESTLAAALPPGRAGADIPAALDRVGAALSALTRGASLVLAPKRDAAPIRHVEFVPLAPGRALLVLVFADGHVENRVFSPPPGQTPSSMREAANFVNAFAEGRTLPELRAALAAAAEQRRREVDGLARELVESGLAAWVEEDGAGSATGRLIVRGTANLLSSPEAQADLERLGTLMDDLERKSDIVRFLELAEAAEGVRVFIGSENPLFSLAGSSLVVSPYMNAERTVVGAVAVLGPTRLNYGRIVPLVDYTAQLVGRLLSERS